jgi:hypothetical protein
MQQPWQRWRRSSLARDLVIVVAIKLVALVAIKLTWFSDAPPNSTTIVAQTLFAPINEIKR